MKTGVRMTKKLKRRDLLKGGMAMTLGVSAGNSVSGAPDENPFPPMKIEKKSPSKYSPLSYLEKVDSEKSPALAFTAETVRDVETWRKDLREKLWELIGETHVPGASNPKGQLLETIQHDGYSQEKWEIDVVPGRSMPFYVLKPKSVSGPYKTALCLHGHGNGAKDVINMPVDDEARKLIGILNTDYAVQCVRMGWCAVVPELFGFGERVDFVEGAREGFDGGCEKPFLNAIQVGKTLIGIRAKDICTLIDWLSFRDDFDMTGLTCLGLSGGGMMTLFTSALDDRIKRVLISGFMTEMKDSILGIRHCSCCYVPHLAEWADFPDIGGLIAPRFLIVQAGRRDAIFPVESTQRAYEKIEKAYAVCNRKENVKLHLHDGFHSFWSPSLDDLLI
ncbi:hypothetical protein ES708_04177 [subsurface metagenome]